MFSALSAPSRHASGRGMEQLRFASERQTRFVLWEIVAGSLQKWDVRHFLFYVVVPRLYAGRGDLFFYEDVSLLAGEILGCPLILVAVQFQNKT